MTTSIDLLTKQFLRETRRYFPAWHLLAARSTRHWFMYGENPRKLPKSSGNTVKWWRRESL